MRRAARVDNNQREIIEALRKIGATVYVIGLPVDLLVGYRARCFIIECKKAGRAAKGLTPGQKDFIASWRGQVRVVESAQEAIDLVTGAYVCPTCGN